jgi:hypothetical protein
MGEKMKNSKAPVPRKVYQAPVVTVLGSLHQLTLDTKVGARCDVTCYHHASH